MIDYCCNCLLFQLGKGVVNYPACYLKSLKEILLQLANSILLFSYCYVKTCLWGLRKLLLGHTTLPYLSENDSESYMCVPLCVSVCVCVCVCVFHRGLEM